MFSSRSICSREIMLAAPRLRGIVNPTIGLETVDLAPRTSSASSSATVQRRKTSSAWPKATVMLILMLMYQPRATEDVLRGRRSRPKPTERTPGRACCVAARSAS